MDIKLALQRRHEAVEVAMLLRTDSAFAAEVLGPRP
jgi:hypothetical protein